MADAAHDGGQVRAHKGFFPAVIGRHVEVREGGGVIFVARENLSVTQGGGQWLVAGRDQHVEQGGGAVLLSRRAHVTNGFVALLVSGSTSLDGQARVLATLSLPVAAAAAVGLALGVLIGRARR